MDDFNPKLKDYYLRLCPPAKPISWFAGDLMHYIFAEGFVKDRIVLDAATGKGYGAYHLSKIGRAKKVIGIDINEEALNYTKSRYKSPNIEFRKMDVCQTNFPSHSFDVITSFETLEHLLPSKTNTFLREIARLLKKDGLFIISTPNTNVYSKFTKTKDHINELSVADFTKLMDKYFEKCQFFYQRKYSREFLEKINSHFDLLVFIKPLIPKTVKDFIKKKILKRSDRELQGNLLKYLEFERIYPANSLGDLELSLIQIAICREAKK